MSHEELLASLLPATETARPASAAPRAGGPVVVPLRAPPPGLVARRAAAQARPEGSSPRASVPQIGDDLRVPPAAVGAAVPARGRSRDPASGGRRAPELDRELDRVLWQHVEVHLERIAQHAPQFGQSVDIVRRSLDLLLKLRAR